MEKKNRKSRLSASILIYTWIIREIMSPKTFVRRKTLKISHVGDVRISERRKRVRNILTKKCTHTRRKRFFFFSFFFFAYVSCKRKTWINTMHCNITYAAYNIHREIERPTEVRYIVGGASSRESLIAWKTAVGPRTKSSAVVTSSRVTSVADDSRGFARAHVLLTARACRDGHGWHDMCFVCPGRRLNFVRSWRPSRKVLIRRAKTDEVFGFFFFFFFFGNCFFDSAGTNVKNPMRSETRFCFFLLRNASPVSGPANR